MLIPLKTISFDPFEINLFILFNTSSIVLDLLFPLANGIVQKEHP